MPVEFKEGDNRPIYTEHLRRGARPIDLQDADEVQFKVKESDSETVVIDDTAAVESGLHGRVSYEFTEETTLPVDTYHAEFRIIWDAANDVTETIPKSGYFEIQINKRIDGEIDPEAWDDPDIMVTTIYTDNIAANTGASVTLEDEIDASNNPITNIPAPSTDSEPARKADTDSLEQKTSGLSTDGSEATLDSIEVASIDDGVAGIGNQITRLFGNNNEWIPLFSPSIPGSYTTTSSTYTRVTSGGDETTIGLGLLNLTNINTFGVTMACELQAADNASEAFARPEGVLAGPFNSAEVSTTSGSYTRVESGSISEGDFEERDSYALQLRSSDEGETVRLRRSAITIWGRIE